MIGVLGPILLRELVATLRQRKAIVTLLLFNAAVGTVVVLAWSAAEGESIVRAEIGEKLFKTVAIAMVALMTLLAPSLSGGAITLERERGTIDLLRTTPISTSRLLMEKFLSSVVYFIILLLTATPLMALSLLLGGVSAFEVAGVTLVLFVLISACGAIGVTVSTMFRRTHASMSVTYIFVLPIGAVFVTALYAGSVEIVAIASVAIGIIGFGIGVPLWQIARHLLDSREPEEQDVDSMEDVAVHAGLLLDRRVFPDRLIWPPRRNAPIPDGVNPILEKDLRLEAPGRSGKMISILIQGGLYLALPVLVSPTFILSQGPGASGLDAMMAVAYPLYLLVFVLLIAPAFSSTALSGERERKTLDLLATTPLPARVVIGGKALASLRGSLGITLLLLCPYLIFAVPTALGTSAGGFEGLGRIPLYMGILAMTVTVITFSGLWISIACRTSLRAMFTTYALMAITVVVPLAAFMMIEPFTDLPYEQFRWIAIPSPAAALISAAGSLEGPSILKLDVTGSTPIWVWFLIFWGATLPFLILGSLEGYRRYVRG